MGSLLDDLSVLYRQNQIRTCNGRQPVCDHKRSPAPDHRSDRLLDLFLCDGIDRRSSLIQDQNTGILDHGSGKGQQLLLTGRKASAALSDLAVQSLLHGSDNAVRRYHPQCLPDLFIGRFRPAVAQILPDGS